MASPSEGGVVVVSESSGPGVDDAMAKRVLRKIDMRLIPLLFVTYMLNFMDKTILSSASVFGLREDTVRTPTQLLVTTIYAYARAPTRARLARWALPLAHTDKSTQHLEGQDYSWVSSVFYFGYLFWTYPTNLLIARLPVARYLTCNTLAWGAVVAATAACTNLGGLLAVRFLLGAAEATITPAFMFVTTSWYTRDEIPLRTGVWFSGNSIGGLAASLFAFGVGHVPPGGGGGVGPWRWMYIILGLATSLWAAALWAALPDGVAAAPFLTPEERRCAAERVVVAGTGGGDGGDGGGTTGRRWDWAQARECLVDPKTWLLVALGVLTQVPNGGTQNFANLVLSGFGFTSLQTTLLNIPYSLLSGGAVVLTGYLAGRFRRANCLLLAAAVVPCVAGAALIYAREDDGGGGGSSGGGGVPRGAQLFGYFCLSTGPAAMPLALSLVQANYRGVAKRQTATALVFVAYCAGNIAGPQFFRAGEAPRYGTAFRAIMVCYALVVACALALRAYLASLNGRRAREEGFEGSAGAAGAVGGGKVVDMAAPGGADALRGLELRSEDYEDVTDWQMPGFRYRL